MRVYAQLKLCFISICIVMNLLFLIHHDNLLLILLLKNYCRNLLRIVLFFFFFQAEDGIRDIGVTGVQTCALPICPAARRSDVRRRPRRSPASACLRSGSKRSPGFYLLCRAGSAEPMASWSFRAR